MSAKQRNTSIAQEHNSFRIPEIHLDIETLSPLMSLVNVINVIVLNPKSKFTDPIAFDIYFEALQPLQHSKFQASYMSISSSKNLLYKKIFSQDINTNLLIYSL